jgi:uncharacterized repeat protein (TIGR01451 family)/LPXTG-motif cell wall-anchored protein
MFVRRNSVFACLVLVAVAGGSVGSMGPVVPADAAVAAAQQWITSVTNPPTSPATLTWGTSGLTATLGAAPNGGVSCGSTNVATHAQLTSFNATNYYSPGAPSDAIGVQACIRTLNAVISREVLFSKPVLSPILHINNLDASELELLPGSTGGTIALQRLSGNVQSQLVGTTIVRPASTLGSSGCLVPDHPAPEPNPTNNSSCGSYRMTEDGGAVESFTLRNLNRVSGADGFYWTISFPTSSLTKTFAPTQIRQGETATATFTLTNPVEEAAVPLTGLSFEDALPAGMTLANGSLTTNGLCGTPSLNGGSAAAGDTTVAVTGVDLAVGPPCTVTVAVTTDSVGSFTNAASSITTGFANLIPSGSPTLEVLERAAPSLTIVKTPVLTDTNSNGTADVGEQVAYSFAVKNTGNVDLVDVAVDDPTLGMLGVAITPASVTLAAGASRTFQSAAYTVGQPDVDAGGLSNTATAEGVYVESDGDRVDVASGPSTVTLPTPARAPSIALAKTAVLADKDGDGRVDAGETVTFRLVVTNTGNVTLTGATLSDAMLGAAAPGPVASLAPGASAPFSVAHVVRESDIVGDRLANSATVTATAPGGATVTATDTVALPAEKAWLAQTGVSVTGAGLAGLLLLGIGAAITVRRRRAV